MSYFINFRCEILIKNLQYYLSKICLEKGGVSEKLHTAIPALPSSLTIDRRRPLTTIPRNGFLPRSGGDRADARRVVFNRVTSASVNRCLLRTILGVVEWLIRGWTVANVPSRRTTRKERREERRVDPRGRDLDPPFGGALRVEGTIVRRRLVSQGRISHRELPTHFLPSLFLVWTRALKTS